ncbi:MAG: metallophosphoesterase [Paludibacteraceae bacterium]|nr:metallophosphoesterase [Paludibacteraceae bacterium]
MLTLTAVVLVLILAALPHIIWLLLYVIGKICGFKVPYAPFGWSAIGLSVLCVILLTYGTYIGRWKYAVTRFEYSNPDVPEAFDGYRIVQISDLHLSTFDDNKQKLTELIDTINAIEPDLICFTGDMVTIGKIEAEPYTNDLQRLTAKNGVISVLGNHDFMIYTLSRSEKPNADTDAEVEKLSVYERDTLGWNLLRNAHQIIHRGNDSITIIGVDNINSSNQGFKTISRGDLPKAMADTDGFRILLSHDPSHWRAEVVPNTDIPLTLSGHTHAAQVRILGWTPSSWMFSETDGAYTDGNQTLYVNIGLGCTVPFRIGANPEITVITLNKAH